MVFLRLLPVGLAFCSMFNKQIYYYNIESEAHARHVRFGQVNATLASKMVKTFADAV